MPERAAIGSTTLLTADDLPAVPARDLPHELWHGVLRVVMPAELREDDVLEGGDLLPGFRRSLADLLGATRR